MGRICSTNQMAGNDGNSVKRDQNSFRPGEADNEFAHQIEAQFGQRLFCKCTETAHQIRVLEMAEIPQSINKS